VDLNLNEYGLDTTANDNSNLNANAQCREPLFSIEKKIKELVTKLQQNQFLMNKQDY